MVNPKIDALAQYITTELIKLNIRQSAVTRLREHIWEIIQEFMQIPVMGVHFNAISRMDIDEAKLVLYPSKQPTLIAFFLGFDIPLEQQNELKQQMNAIITNYHEAQLENRYYLEDIAFY